MPLKPEDVNLKNFLGTFTWNGDPNKGSRIELDLALFVQIASLLKINLSLEKLIRK